VIGWRIPLATICLLTGVAFGTEADTGWRAIGGVFLVFVPALIVDHVLKVVNGPPQWRRAVGAQRRARTPQEYPPVTTLIDLLPGRKTEEDSENGLTNEKK
jgi:hypothetical protein